MSDGVQIALIGGFVTLAPITAAGIWKLVSMVIANMKKAAEQKVRAEISQAEADATISELKEENADLLSEVDEKDATIEAQDQVITSLTGSVEKFADAFEALGRGKAVSP